MSPTKTVKPWHLTFEPFTPLPLKLRQSKPWLILPSALDKQYPTISKSWINHWNRIIPFFTFPPDIRKAIYTTNAYAFGGAKLYESMSMTLRKVLRNHRSFPTDESAMKVIYLAIAHISKKWTMPIRDWKAALNRFAIEFEGRFPM